MLAADSAVSIAVKSCRHNPPSISCEAETATFERLPTPTMIEKVTFYGHSLSNTRRNAIELSLSVAEASIITEQQRACVHFIKLSKVKFLIAREDNLFV